MWCRKTVKNFVRIVCTAFEKNKKVQNLSRIQSFDFDVIAHAGATLGVE